MGVLELIVVSDFILVLYFFYRIVESSLSIVDVGLKFELNYVKS